MGKQSIHLGFPSTREGDVIFFSTAKGLARGTVKAVSRANQSVTVAGSGPAVLRVGREQYVSHLMDPNEWRGRIGGPPFWAVTEQPRRRDKSAGAARWMGPLARARRRAVEKGN